MSSLEEKYKLFEEKNKAAEIGGGEVRVKKHHAAGKKTARERILILLDEGTFIEMDKLVKHHNHDFNMFENRPAGDGFITGYGKIDGRLVYVLLRISQFLEEVFPEAMLIRSLKYRILP